MAVLSKLEYKGKNITKYNNEIIRNIKYNGVDYHFANLKEVNRVCQNSVNEPINDLRIKGESIQDGEPTTENPIKIKSVGEKTDNLADLSKVEIANSTPHVTFNYDNLTGTLELTSVPTTYDYALLSAEDLGLEIGKTYNYGGDVIVTGKTTNQSSSAIFSLGTGADSNITFRQDGTKHITGTFAYTGQDKVNLRLFFNYGSEEPAKVIYKNIYISEVSNEFEPFGYFIPVKVSGKNLFENDYNPKTTNIYLSEPLGKIGDYVDYIDYKNKKFVKTIGKYVFTGNEEFSVIGIEGGQYSYYALTLGEYNYVISNQGLCSHLKQDTISSSNTIIGFNVTNSSGYNDARILFRPDISKYSTLSSWKEFLVSQYNAGTPVEIYYVLSIPTEEAIDVKTIETFDGTSILDIDTTIKSSESKVNYWKQIMDTPVEVDEYPNQIGFVLSVKSNEYVEKINEYNGYTLEIGGLDGDKY